MKCRLSWAMIVEWWNEMACLLFFKIPEFRMRVRACMAEAAWSSSTWRLWKREWSWRLPESIWSLSFIIKSYSSSRRQPKLMDRRVVFFLRDTRIYLMCFLLKPMSEISKYFKATCEIPFEYASIRSQMLLTNSWLSLSLTWAGSDLALANVSAGSYFLHDLGANLHFVILLPPILTYSSFYLALSSNVIRTRSSSWILLFDTLKYWIG